MNIGIDIDGVLLNIEKFQLVHGEKYFRKAPVNRYAYEVSDIFNVSQADGISFWMDNFFDYANQKCRVGAAKVINDWHKSGDNIIIITGRGCSQDECYGLTTLFGMKKFTESFLRNNRIHYDDILYTKNNDDECSRCSIDCMIEDNPVRISKLIDVTSVICFAALYNEDMPHTNASDKLLLKRASNWHDVNKIINAHKQM